MPEDVALVDKLIALEQRRLDHNEPASRGIASVLAPFQVDVEDPESIRHAQQCISKFIGLTGCDLYVVRIPQPEGRAGCIHRGYKDGRGDLIEVSEELKGYNFTYALCHEICHKWLEVRYSFEAASDEILTDVAVVFLGLGKIALNGCTGEDTTSLDGANVVRQSRYGYLSMRKFAFAYDLVCEMRGVPVSGRCEHLTTAAQRAVTSTGQSHIVREARRWPSYARDADIHLQVLVNYVDGLLEVTKEHLTNIRQDPREQSVDDTDALDCLFAFKDAQRQERRRQTEDLERALTAGIRSIVEYSGLEPVSWDLFSVVACPQCGQRLKLQEAPNARQRCGRCQSSFRCTYNGDAFRRLHRGSVLGRIRRFFGPRRVGATHRRR